MATALDLITRALKSFGAVAAGETLPNDEAQDGLDALNSMLGVWNTESLTVLGQAISTYTLVSGTQSYTLGPTGVFVATRPQKITWANILYTGTTPNNRYPLELIDYEQWANIRVQSQPVASLPSVLYCDDAFPLATLYLWGSPGASMQLELYTWQALTSFAALTTSFAFPPEYEEAIIYNLAIRLAPMFGRQVSESGAILAINSKAALQRLNGGSPIMEPDAAVVGSSSGVWNIYSGQ